MADRYWVGGTANWDATAGTKWALTSGGAGGQAVPTAADDVFFDASSGAVTCTVSGTRVAKSINCTGFTGTLAGASTPALTISGSLTLVAGMTLTYAGTTTFNATGTLTSAGKTLGPVTIDGVGITVTLGDALTSSGAITVTRGTFTTNNFNVTATSLSSSNSNTRTINLGSSTINLSDITAINFQINTSLTFNAGTSTINLSLSSAQIIGGTINGGTGVTFYNVSFTSTSAATRSIQSSNTFNNLTVTAPSAAGVTQVTFDSRQTINGTLSTTGTAGNRRVWFRGTTYGIAQTLTINSAPSLTDADFRDIYVIGTAAPISGTRIGDLRGCRGITFDTPKTVYWNLAGAQNWSANGWSDTSTGTPNTDFFPLAQDTATFTNAGSVTGTITMNSAVPYTGTVDMSGRTSAMTLSVGTFTVYGDWKNGSGTTLSGVGDNLTFSGRRTQIITSAGKTFASTIDITVDSYGGSVELADALTLRTLTVTNGTFDTKNYSVTAASSLLSSSSNVRTITLGSSTVTVSDVTFAATNLTFNAGTSLINITNQNVQAPGFNFYDVTYTNTGFAYIRTGSFNSLNLGRKLTEMQSDITVNGTLSFPSATSSLRGYLFSTTIGTATIINVGTLSANDVDFRDVTITGTAAGTAPTRAGDLGGNTGITFPAPKTVYWNLSGSQFWNATGWCTGSGGAPAANNFPLAQDTAIFDDAGAAGTITIEGINALPTINASSRTSAMTLTHAGFNYGLYGSFTLGSGVTIAGTETMFVAGRGTITFTTAGKTITFPISINTISGTVQLGDALTLNSARTLTLTSGTFDAVTYNVTTGLFDCQGTLVKTLKMSSGTWTLSGTGTVWNANFTSSSNFRFYKNTANIVLSDTSTSARTFAGAGFSYNKLTIGGATGISTTTITENNQFSELASTKTVAHTIALGSTTQTFGKWTVTGTVGNVVTLTGTGTSHILAGACTDSIDYLAMGSIGFAATSPGEFYAGANSTGTAGAPVYRTAKPADSTRYWVGGTGNWSDTARWSTSSGGGSGASVPRSHDDVVFDSASNATAYTATVDAVTGGIRTKALTVAGPLVGNLTLAGSTAMVGIHGNVTLPATGLTRTYTGAMTLSSNSTGRTFTTNGVTLASAITVNGVDCGWALGSALNIGTSNNFTVTNGLIDFDTYNVTVGAIVSNFSSSRTIDFGSSTVNAGLTGLNFGTTETVAANLTIVAGTSTINIDNTNGDFDGNGKTFYNVAFTSSSAGTPEIRGVNTFNNLSFTGVFFAGVKNILVYANQTVNGTLTFVGGSDATCRQFFRSDTLGTTRTLTCAAFSGTDADFRDITIAGAAAPVSGTRLGDCKGNSGITFDAAKTVYYRNTAGNWGATTWAFTNGGTADVTAFPLAQDTAVFPSSPTPYPSSGATCTSTVAYNIGTIDMSARTSDTMTLATSTSTPSIYGNWINGTGTTLTGTGILTFAGRGSQTITSAGKSFTQAVTINTPGGSVTLQDALDLTGSNIVLTSGTIDAASYNVTFGSLTNTSLLTRTLGVGSGTWTVLNATSPWSATSTNLTVTGTGTISLTSASAKTFAGGGVSYSGITLNQGGNGTLTISGNNTFKTISSTAAGASNITLGTTTQTITTSWTAAGTAGNILTVQGTSASSPGTLVFTGSGAAAAAVDYLAVTGVRAYPL